VIRPSLTPISARLRLEAVAITPPRLAKSTRCVASISFLQANYTMMRYTALIF
jgi:hypothetical protein